MSFFFKNKRKTTNSSDNNITISTNTDVMLKIGEDIGFIKSSININNDKLDSIYKTLEQHHKRLERLEYENQNNKSVKNNRKRVYKNI